MTLQEEELTCTAVLVPLLQNNYNATTSSSNNLRSPDALLTEAVGLARSIDLDIVFSEIVNIAKFKAATLFGSGQVQEIGQRIEESKIELVIVDFSLTPVQQRNLERSWNCKVIDRTGLILEIFGRRAHSKESSLQVELASLNYQKGRLVRSWTHLERQRGGSGFMGGPGETQIESDRRLIQGRILRLQQELAKVVKHRSLHRQQRKKSAFPVISLVGYTNAGKSTLFNLLSGADVLAKNMLFATLSPTLRQVILPHGSKVIISDTVGFISNLPPQLIMSFRATLEEVVESDIILHVRDISDPDQLLQAQDVENILTELNVKAQRDYKIIEVWNKVDKLSEAELNLTKILSQSETTGRSIFLISSLTGEGVDKLLNALEVELTGELIEYQISLPVGKYSLLNFIHEYAVDIKEDAQENGDLCLQFKMHKSNYEQLLIKLGKI